MFLLLDLLELETCLSFRIVDRPELLLLALLGSVSYFKLVLRTVFSMRQLSFFKLVYSSISAFSAVVLALVMDLAVA